MARPQGPREARLLKAPVTAGADDADHRGSPKGAVQSVGVPVDEYGKLLRGLGPGGELVCYTELGESAEKVGSSEAVRVLDDCDVRWDETVGHP